MLRFDSSTADIDIDSLIVCDARQGIAILAFGEPVPRVGETFEYEEDGTRYVLQALKFHPRPPTPRMRRHHQRPDYWVTVRLLGVVELEVTS